MWYQSSELKTSCSEVIASSFTKKLVAKIIEFQKSRLGCRTRGEPVSLVSCSVAKIISIIKYSSFQSSCSKRYSTVVQEISKIKSMLANRTQKLVFDVWDVFSSFLSFLWFHEQGRFRSKYFERAYSKYDPDTTSGNKWNGWMQEGRQARRLMSTFSIVWLHGLCFNTVSLDLCKAGMPYFGKRSCSKDKE